MREKGALRNPLKDLLARDGGKAERGFALTRETPLNKKVKFPSGQKNVRNLLHTAPRSHQIYLKTCILLTQHNEKSEQR